ncbi:Zn-ribbon domain-containing OB-fold protein [Cryptosporangium sp. NPDC051539]|uniref:Zn-ribbon domain-containing OB-fold protein n=1 Tax=Cryptosporangium sp. NPDC051539 TaxID=3363962 RepID=UPI0037B6A64D
MSGVNWLPRPDRDSADWWAALARHELLLQACQDCGRRRWPARAICNRCSSLRWDWIQACGTATIASWTVTRRPPVPGVEVPYVVVLARLDDQSDVLVPGFWGGDAEGLDLAIGLPVVVGFDDLESAEGTRSSLLRWASQVTP